LPLLGFTEPIVAYSRRMAYNSYFEITVEPHDIGIRKHRTDTIKYLSTGFAISILCPSCMSKKGNLNQKPAGTMYRRLFVAAVTLKPD